MRVSEAPDQGVQCPLTESMVIAECIYDQTVQMCRNQECTCHIRSKMPFYLILSNLVIDLSVSYNFPTQI